MQPAQPAMTTAAAPPHGLPEHLISTLKTAAGKTAAQVYPGDELCAAGNQWCADASPT